jgi:hypothetical protein
MRAKLAVAIAALGLVASTVPSFAMNTMGRVQRILWGDQAVSLVLTQPAVVAAPTTTVVTTTPVLSDATIIREIPAVLAPTSTGVAIISEIPSDLDIRREDLGRKIDSALSLSRINAGEATELKSALALVGTREVQMRGDGYLSPKEAKTLFKAMDKIGSDLDWLADTSNQFMGFRID